MKIKTFQKEIDATHPVSDDSDLSIAADTLAMKLIGERWEKRELVDLVRWLIMRKPEGILDTK